MLLSLLKQLHLYLLIETIMGIMVLLIVQFIFFLIIHLIFMVFKSTNVIIALMNTIFLILLNKKILILRLMIFFFNFIFQISNKLHFFLLPIDKPQSKLLILQSLVMVFILRKVVFLFFKFVVHFINQIIEGLSRIFNLNFIQF
jgi:hypothetical protein